MGASLTEAINNSSYPLGDNFELLGAKKGFFAGRTFLAYDEKKGWKVANLNVVEIFLRFIFGCYKETHLATVTAKLASESEVNSQLKKRIRTLWKKAYPNKKNSLKRSIDKSPNVPQAEASHKPKPHSEPNKQDIKFEVPQQQIPQAPKPEPKPEQKGTASAPQPKTNPGTATQQASNKPVPPKPDIKPEPVKSQAADKPVPPKSDIKPSPVKPQPAVQPVPAKPDIKPSAAKPNPIPKAELPKKQPSTSQQNPSVKNKSGSAAGKPAQAASSKATEDLPFNKGGQKKQPNYTEFFGQFFFGNNQQVPPQQSSWSSHQGTQFTMEDILKTIFGRRPHGGPGPSFDPNMFGFPGLGPSKKDIIAELKQKIESTTGMPVNTPDELKKAYKKWMLKNHPDKAPEDKKTEATKAFQEFNALLEEYKKLNKWN